MQKINLDTLVPQSKHKMKDGSKIETKIHQRFGKSILTVRVVPTKGKPMVEDIDVSTIFGKAREANELLDRLAVLQEEIKNELDKISKQVIQKAGHMMLETV